MGFELESVTAYVFRVWLLPNPPLGFDPDGDVWRDIAVEGSHTLATFHRAIFEAFDRYDDHAYEFITHDDDGIATRSYVAPSMYEAGPSWPPMDDAEIDRFLEHSVPDDVEAAAVDRFRELREDPPEEGNAAETTIEELEPERLQSMLYEFDFGDQWEHHVRLEETKADSLPDGPTVVAEQGDAPPQYPE